MGSGIAQLAAQRGFHTILYDVNKTMPARAEAAIQASLQQLIDKGRITTAEKDDTLSRLRFTSDMNDCIADVFIEAIIENADSKAALFNQLHEFNHSEVLFATNTSSLSVSSIAAGVIYPGRVVGMHFFNPAPVMKLVEVIQGQQTSQATVDSICWLATQLGKTAVLCKDSPGFIVNHVARPYYLEALRLMQNGVDPLTVDSVMEASGFKMGPFKLMDLIGNDINYAVSVSVYEGLGQPARLAPSPLQQQKVTDGALGKKAGRGFFNY